MRNRFLVGLAGVLLLLGCSSSDGGSTGAGGASGSSGGASSGGATGKAGSGSAGAAAGSTSSTPNFGTIGTGDVACNTGTDGKSCSAGMACCDQYPFAPKACVAAFADCKCASPGAGCGEVNGCDGPEDCPGGVCCALSGATNLHMFAGTSCKASCDPKTETVVCKVAADCASGECNPTGTTFSQCL